MTAQRWEPERRRVPRTRNVRREVRELRLVEDPEAEPTALSPTWFKAARHICPACGYRSVDATHPKGKRSGQPVCLLPPELRSDEL